MAGVNTWAFYTFIDRTAALYNGLTSYASGTISLTEAKQSIISDIASYIVIVVVVPTAYSLSAGGGRVLASLYTRRQLNYLSRLLLDDFGEEHPNNLLYYSRHMSEIPNSLSHEIAELNTEIFNLLFGQVYYVGIIILFKKWRTRDESQFVQFLNAHKRIDLQAEQIALSGESVCMAEENELRQKLDSSVHSQIRNGYFFSIIVGVAHGLGSVTDDNYAQQLLNEFSLGHLIDRYSMNGKRQVWSELLSIGEQQRLMIVSALLIGTETARLLILDETTSGCDKQTEETIYKHLQRSNLQFISISHRKEISKYHSRQMTIDATDTPIPTPVFKTRF
ncbi:unnamed protein product [Adineta steineri]|uniref:ABC transporter domain-containing protein n=1 Tax=Adineta steineri TaxID=433720 RepID=A0A814LYR4_9BILA|nr:unnamed protein product [Adineta steineri]